MKIEIAKLLKLQGSVAAATPKAGLNEDGPPPPPPTLFGSVGTDWIHGS